MLFNAPVLATVRNAPRIKSTSAIAIPEPLAALVNSNFELNNGICLYLFFYVGKLKPAGTNLIVKLDPIAFCDFLPKTNHSLYPR